MATVTLADVSALVPKRIEMLEKKGRIGFFPQNKLWEKILNNPIGGGGPSLQIPITVASPSFAVSASDLIARTNSTGDVTKDATFNYKVVSGEFTITQSQINKVGGSSKGLKGYLDRRIINGTEGYLKKLEDVGINGTGAAGANFAGLKSFWTGAAYGGITRDDTADFGGVTYNFSDVLGDEAAYTYVAGAGTATRKDTRWSANTYLGTTLAAATAAEKAAAVHTIISDLYIHIKKYGHNPDFLLVGSTVYNRLVRNLQEKGAPNAAGAVTNFVMNGDEMKFGTMTVILSDKCAAGEAFILSSDYIYTASVDGFDLTKPYVGTEPSPAYAAAKVIDIIGEGCIVTDCVTKHGFIEALDA